MRKLGLKHAAEKKRKKNNLILGIILIGIMCLSVLGYGLGSFSSEKKGGKITYNGFDFYEYNGFWVLTINGVDFFFNYNPEQVEKINSDVKKINDYQGKPLYILSESDDAGQEIVQNMYGFVQRVQFACLEGEECEDETWPIKTCEDNFIIIKEAEVSDIRQEENCVFIHGNEEELVMLTDEFLFKILDIEQ